MDNSTSTLALTGSTSVLTLANINPSIDINTGALRCAGGAYFGNLSTFGAGIFIQGPTVFGSTSSLSLGSNVSAQFTMSSFDLSGSPGTFRTPTGTATFSGPVGIAPGSASIDFSSSSGTFRTPTGTATFSGPVGIAPGSASIDFSSSSGTFRTPTGTATFSGPVVFSNTSGGLRIGSLGTSFSTFIHGTTNVSTGQLNPGDIHITANISYGFTFPSTPRVIINIDGNSDFYFVQAWPRDITTTNFKVIFRNQAGFSTGASPNTNVFWIAFL